MYFFHINQWLAGSEAWGAFEPPGMSKIPSKLDANLNQNPTIGYFHEWSTNLFLTYQLPEKSGLMARAYLPLAYLNKALSNPRFFLWGYLKGGWFSHKTIGYFWWHQPNKFLVVSGFLPLVVGRGVVVFNLGCRRELHVFWLKCSLKKTNLA